MTTVKVANAERMMIAVTPNGTGISVSFADGHQGTVPFRDNSELAGHSRLKGVQLPNPYEFILPSTDDDTLEHPSDFVRHDCDQTYRPRMEMLAKQGEQTVVKRDDFGNTDQHQPFLKTRSLPRRRPNSTRRLRPGIPPGNTELVPAQAGARTG